jgi:hypothetical protein
VIAGYSLRTNTYRTYQMHLRTMTQLSSSLGVDAERPLSEQSLCLLAAAYCKAHKITTLPNFVSALSWRAEIMGHGPLPRGLLWARVKTGLDNLFSSTNFATPARALTLSDLCAMYRHIDHSTFAGARDWCACLFAFYGLLRINEYMNAGLRVREVAQHPWGIALVIAFSKTNSRPVQVDIIRRDDELCPLAAYIRYRAQVQPVGTAPPAPFFLATPDSDRALTDDEFIRRIRALLHQALRCDASKYSGHSFRRGGASALALAGVPEATIQLHGRWSSLTYRQYLDVQNSPRVRLLATASLYAYTQANPLLGNDPQRPQ